MIEDRNHNFYKNAQENKFEEWMETYFLGDFLCHFSHAYNFLSAQIKENFLEQMKYIRNKPRNCFWV